MLAQSLERQRELAAAQLTQAQLDFERAQVESQQLVNRAYEMFRTAQGEVVEWTRRLAAVTKLLAQAREGPLSSSPGC